MCVCLNVCVTCVCTFINAFAFLLMCICYST